MPTVRCQGATVQLQRDEWQFPSECPCCHTALRRDGVHWFCPNFNCPDQVKSRLVHAVGKRALDWDGCGEATIRALIQGANIARLIDLFKLSEQTVRFCLKDAAAAKFLDERERVKKASLWRKLHALGFEGIGSTLSKELAQRYGSVRGIAEHAAELTAMVGPVRAAALLLGMQNMAEELEELETLGFMLSDENGADKPLAGLTFVITGTLMSGGRDRVAAKIEAKGGLVKNSVTKGTSYLVVGEAPGQNKQASAAKHGVKIIDEPILYQLMGEPFTPVMENVAEKEY